MSKNGLEEIKSSSGYFGKRLICFSCHGEGELVDNFCRWCGKVFPKELSKKVIKPLEESQDE